MMGLEEVRFLFVGLRLGLQLSPSVSKVVLRQRCGSAGDTHFNFVFST